MTFTCGYNEMTGAIAYRSINGRYWGHPLLLQMIVILRPRTLLAKEETVSEVMVDPQPMTLKTGGGISMSFGSKTCYSYQTIWMTVWLYGFLCMVNYFYCTTDIR